MGKSRTARKRQEVLFVICPSNTWVFLIFLFTHFLFFTFFTKTLNNFILLFFKQSDTKFIFKNFWILIIQLIAPSNGALGIFVWGQIGIIPICMMTLVLGAGLLKMLMIWMGRKRNEEEEHKSQSQQKIPLCHDNLILVIIIPPRFIATAACLIQLEIM
jgi:hypothetical protein